MQPYQQRVLDEQADLEAKIERLAIFIKSPTFETVEPDERARLIRQHAIMEQYSAVLVDRISNFS